MKIIGKVSKFLDNEQVQELMGLFGTLYFGKMLIKCIYKDLKGLNDY